MDISLNALELNKQCHSEPTLIRGDISAIALKNESIAGIYNLGVLEHFDEKTIHSILLEFNRVLRSKGTAILFIPPEYGSTVLFFKGVHYFLNSILKKNVFFQPAEPSRIKSKKHFENLLHGTRFELEEFNFGFNDLFTYIVIVIKKTN
jgi:ubiquinone/menaquinone biosynthesis C-methylase UbiE